MHSLTATPRTVTGKTSELLAKDGLIPAIVYGPKQDPITISLSLHEFEAVLRHGGESALIELSGLEKPMQVLIHDLDRDPVTHTPRHTDLYAVQKGAKVTVSTQLSFVGESQAVKEGANLVKVLHEVEIESDPSKIPTEIEVDISSLVTLEDQIRVSDIKAPAGVEILTPGDEIVALAQAVEEEPEEETAAPDMDSIEVEKKGKEEESTESE
ncbi:50S ribosomal protein L25 [Patescibacteria group bacterium]|nr:50S ribosomal protein L25 [Patescibacteria group bacterium]MBU1501094.1 50S ribosomal protein L25 [Patescibacteria group bacterium]MBU2081033.1 50S ribosomal protein L25 [Patescibacteria group bacterium]MBU2124124.1 50S ribosomal protein L25 [Patescibacteria group bacterium]MBU2194980.1 50S ribosomal protein L25 [Patescibacteria group bacterium]